MKKGRMNEKRQTRDSLTHQNLVQTIRSNALILQGDSFYDVEKVWDLSMGFRTSHGIIEAKQRHEWL